MHRGERKPAWLDYSITKRDTTASFDFDFVKLGVQVKNYEHDTYLLSFKAWRSLPQLVDRISGKDLAQWSGSRIPSKDLPVQEKSILIDFNENLHLLPVYPQKPLVMHCPGEVTLCPASETAVFTVSLVNIGLFKNETLAYTWDTIQTPKKTLYGEPAAGIVATTFEEAFIEQEADAKELALNYPLCILHPLHIVNKSDESITIKDLLINYPQMSILEYHGYLTSECIRYEISGHRVAISVETPPHLKSAYRIQKPSVSEPNFVLQGIQLFRNMVGF